MKLNKIMLATVVALGLSSVANAAGTAGNGVINFSGDIVTAPCTIDSETLEVSMGMVSSNALADGGYGPTSPIDITLQDCDITDQTGVKVTFTGTAAGTSSNTLAIGGQASGAGIQILSGETPVILNTPTANISLNAGNNLLRFNARMVGLMTNDETPVGQNIVPGDFNAVANFSMAYQ